jgi:hypothetical protein
VLFNEAKLSIFPLENSHQGVAALPEEELTLVLARVRHFDEFTADNDPHGEHDLGNFELAASEIRH